jgi:hypothetical protein
MKKAANKKQDSGEYESTSTIDSPPREPKEAKQPKLPGIAEYEERVNEFLAENPPAEVDITITVKLKSGKSSRAISLGLAGVPSDRAEELIGKRIKGEQFVRELRSIVGKPREDVEQVPLRVVADTLKADPRKPEITPEGKKTLAAVASVVAGQVSPEAAEKQVELSRLRKEIDELVVRSAGLEGRELKAAAKNIRTLEKKADKLAASLVKVDKAQAPKKSEPTAAEAAEEVF